MYSVPATLKAQALGTEDVVAFSQLFTRTANSEAWKEIWTRSIRLSAAMYAVRDAKAHGDAPDSDGVRLPINFVDDYMHARATPYSR